MWHDVQVVIITGKPKRFGHSDFQRREQTVLIVGLSNIFPLKPNGHLL
ncbi:hypothetical protein J3D57_004000 [Bacillus amyloliquefaciens]|nr:hypothetical protein [Bacillus amyloliquefaciens]